MRTNRIIMRTILGVSLGLITGIAARPAQAAEPQAGGSSLVAVGAVEDTFSACLARIPRDASAGQRMMAERSCKRDESEREIARNAPHK